MRSFFYIFLILGLGISLSQACKDNKKKKAETPAATPSSVPPGPDAPVGTQDDKDTNTNPDAPIGVADTKAREEAVKRWNAEVMKKTWKICRTYGTASSYVTIIFKEDQQVMRTEKTFNNNTCTDSGSGSPLSEAGVWKFKDAGQKADEFLIDIDLKGVPVLQRIQLKDSKLLFCDYDTINNGSTKRCDQADPTEPHSSGDKPEMVQATR